uniref:Uncharacterized protein n=1 Tax=Sus scrofa TaxID=9823 RepID=A0A4X1VNM2_PIG
MKSSVALGGLLLLCVSLMWMCSGQEPVLVQCSCLHFRTIAKRALFYKDELVGPDELFLGTGCLAIHVRADELEFDYPVTLCGIEIQVFYDGTFINSWLTYKPRNHLLSAELRLECMVPRLLELNKKKSTNDTERINSLIIPPPVQYWFLIQYRYCVRCGYAHFRDNWVRIPSKSNTYQAQTFCPSYFLPLPPCNHNSVLYICESVSV